MHESWYSASKMGFAWWEGYSLRHINGQSHESHDYEHLMTMWVNEIQYCTQHNQHNGGRNVRLKYLAFEMAVIDCVLMVHGWTHKDIYCNFICKTWQKKILEVYCIWKSRADSRLAPNQWETSLQCNDVFHWLEANIETTLEVSSQVTVIISASWLT